MTKARRRRERAREATSPPPSPWRAAAVVGLVGVAVALGTVLWRSDTGRTVSPARNSDPARSEPESSATARPAGEDTPRACRPLLGEWRRPDGGYVLSVQGVAADGGATVQYFNPRPIRVARAEARQEGEIVGLFVEFGDVNYPGSTYTLEYDAASDQLRGVYYQAVQGAHFEVVFDRSR